MSKVGATVTVVQNQIAKAVLRGTPMENLGLLFASTTCCITLKDVEQLAKAMKAQKPFRKMDLLGGKVGGKLCSADDVVTISKLPGLDMSRAQLVGLLSTPAQKLSGLLGSNQSDLLGALTRHAAPATEGDGGEDGEGGEGPPKK